MLYYIIVNFKLKYYILY